MQQQAAEQARKQQGFENLLTAAPYGSPDVLEGLDQYIPGFKLNPYLRGKLGYNGRSGNRSNMYLGYRNY